MTNPTINLRDLVILIADPSSYVRMISHSMLRGFGANKVLEVGQTTGLLQTLSHRRSISCSATRAFRRTAASCSRAPSAATRTM